MSQAKKLPKNDVDPTPPSPESATVQELRVTAHMMSLPSGLFCFVNEGVTARRDGMPGIRVSPRLRARRMSKSPASGPMAG